LTGAAAGTTLALASWPASAPNFNHAALGLLRNLFRMPGAIAAHLMMQFFRLSSIVFLAPQAYGAGGCLLPGALNV